VSTSAQQLPDGFSAMTVLFCECGTTMMRTEHGNYFCPEPQCMQRVKLFRVESRIYEVDDSEA
jgi:hypothetical protein